MNPGFNEEKDRWEVEKEGALGMRALACDDLRRIADQKIMALGYAPGLHEDWVDHIVVELSKEYRIGKPYPEWIKKCARDIMNNSGVDIPCRS